MDEKTYTVYIATNKTNRVLYIGVTNNIQQRMYQHTHKIDEGFTKNYNINKLIYIESSNDINAAIAREKQLKGWRRQKKIDLIESLNPDWVDLLSG